MQEINGNLFESEMADAICITTNGFTNRQGSCTMGRGCAKEAKVKWPGIQMLLGSMIQKSGNRVHCLTDDALTLKMPGCWKDQTLPYHLLSFPVKPVTGTANATCSNIVPHMRKQFKEGNSVPGWAMMGTVDIIRCAAEELVALTNANHWKSVVIPRPGCGAGGLNWERDVKDLLGEMLDGRFYIITF